MKKIREVIHLLKDRDFTTKISIFFSTTSYGEDYDTFEKNVTRTNLNPKTIKARVSEISAETAYYKRYGINQSGAVEVLCEDKYRKWFENCSRIVINSHDYSVYKDASGSRVLITPRTGNLLRVVLERKD